MHFDEGFIEKCLNNDPKAQGELYKAFAPKMFGICLRYTRNQMEAEDILQEGFIKVFRYLKDYRNDGSLEGWVRRTMVNTAINFFKKRAKYLNDLPIEEAEPINQDEESAIDKLSAKELLEFIRELPDGYRVVFNLNIIEGYTHKEIGELLNISENTSKSQLSRARSVLQAKLKNKVKGD
ncbi:MAG TPA: sigma-70 family RNA polymerase sigma factor [Bacteroidales bacterium]|nr:sigma-70 family RNA polymerase sigma factor [Bacteroidales bacterium]